MTIDHFSELKRAVQEFQDHYPKISLDNAFVAWFLRAFIVTNDEEAINALKGGARDKGIDAVYIDHESRAVFVIQGKYHQGSNIFSEKRSDVIALGQLGRSLLLEDERSFNALLENADITVKDILKQVRKAIQKDNYRLILQFVTTGKVSETHKQESEQLIEDWQKASFEIYSRNELLRMMQDYLEGVAPPVPTLRLPIHGEEFFSRYDNSTGISSWVFSMRGNEIGELFNEIGIRLFARNIRGFLGSTAINKEIQATLEQEPEFFWYFNNGITIVCDEAKQISERGKKYLRATNAQIINGQQTTRVLASIKNNQVATVMVKLIVVPRETESAHMHYTKLINEIVKATNRQNAIQQSDLKSNDPEQVRIEREFRKLNYQYIRKRQTKSEARRIAPRRYVFMINKDELARRVAASLFDPYEIRKGVNRLFEDDLYQKIFNGRPVSEYLIYYWLGRIVPLFIKKDIRRGYAKWLVLNYLWSEIGNELKRPMLREKFRLTAERQYKYKELFKPLYRAIDEIFIASLAFYRENKRSKPEIALDASTFFKYANLHNKFKRFLKKDKKRLCKINKRLYHFLDVLEKTEV